MNPEQRLSKLIEFMGFGNPEGKRKILFVGIEEAGGFSDEPTVQR